MAIINPNIVTDEEKIKNILTRGVEDIIDKEELTKALLSQKQLRIKFGIDPTGPKIHLGRTIPLRKLREFQKLGHQIVLIIGDFTAQVGDASDKNEKRPILTREIIDENLRDYKNQIGKIIDLSKTEFVYNSEWLNKLTFSEIVKLAEIFTVQQMLARRNFKDRYEDGKEISLREFLYPIMQGYDSVMVKADVEIGGFDQLFNLKAGRYIQEFYGLEKQNILTTEMLEGINGEKMSTSQGNVINIIDPPNEIFGKLMSIKDDLILKYFILCTEISNSEIEEAKNFLADSKNNPRDLKMKLAKTIVAMYYSELAAAQAENNFIETFQKNGVPDNLESIIIAEADKEKSLGEFLVAQKLIKSKTEWKRLINVRAIKLIDTDKQNEEVVLEDFEVPVYPGVFKLGKKKFVKISKS